MSDAPSIGSVLNTRVESNARNAPSPNLQIIDLPADLESGRRSERLRGDVVRVSPTNEVTIRTERGDIRAQVSVDAALNIENGTRLDIRLDAGTPRETAYIRPAVNQQPADVNTVQNTSGPVRNVGLPPALSVEEIVQSPQIYTLTRLPQDSLRDIAQPFVPTTQQNATPAAFSFPALISIEPVTFSVDAPSSLVASALPSFFTTDFPVQPDARLNVPVVEVPLAVVAAQTLGTSIENLITVTTDDVPALTNNQASIGQVFIDDASPPLLHITRESVPTRAEQFEITDDNRIGELRAVLIGFTPEQHFPVLEITTQGRFHQQLYALDVSVQDITVGREFVLNVSQVQNVTADILPAQLAFPPITSAYFLSAESWPVLQDALAALNASTTQISAQMVLPSPSAPANIIPAALFFIAAMRSGDVSGWLGERAMEALRSAGKGNLIERIGREMLGMARLNAEPVSQDWRALSLPLAWQDEVHKMVVYYRRENQHFEGQDQMRGENTRFVMDLSLSNMGKVQLDALFGKRENNARLDLILRTENSFSAAMKQQMRESYKRALDETKISGELSFQGSIENWVRITPDVVSEYSRDI